MSTHASSVENNVPTKPILIKERLTFLIADAPALRTRTPAR